jgi:hypothetical protein
MESIFQKLIVIGERAKLEDLSVNHLFWMTYMVPLSSSAANKFSLIGSALTVFDQDNIAGVITSVTGNCTAHPTSTYDVKSGRLILSYNYAEFANKKDCSKIINPTLLGFDFFSNPETIDIKTDVKSIMVAAAVSLKVISISDLVEVVVLREFIFDPVLQTNLQISKYYHPDYPGL